MAFDPVIDVDALCRPFDGDRPEGEFLDPRLRDDPIGKIEFGSYKAMVNWEEEKIKRLWGRDRKYGAIPDPPENASWESVIADCQKLLMEKSKDLRLIGMLVVALSYRYGIVGVRDGLNLLNRMLGQFAVNLHPQAARLESLDESHRKKQLITAFRSLPAVPDFIASAIQLAPLSEQHDDEVSALRCEIAKYLLAAGTSLLPEQQKHFEQTAISEAFVNQKLTGSSPEFLGALCETLAEASELCEQTKKTLSDALSGTLSKETVTSDYGKFRNVRTALEECQRIVTPIHKQLLKQAADQTSPTSSTSPSSATHTSDASGPGGQKFTTSVPQNRQHAFQALRQIQLFFEQTEPHSPIPSLLERAIQWGKMSLKEVLNELVGDVQGAEAALTNRANIRIKEQENSRSQSAPSEEARQPSTDVVQEKAIDPFGG